MKQGKKFISDIKFLDKYLINSATTNHKKIKLANSLSSNYETIKLQKKVIMHEKNNNSLWIYRKWKKRTKNYVHFLSDTKLMALMKLFSLRYTNTDNICWLKAIEKKIT